MRCNKSEMSKLSLKRESQTEKDELGMAKQREQKLLQQLEEKESQIRRLSIKLQKYEAISKGVKEVNSENNDYYMKLLQREIEKTEKLASVVDLVVERVTLLLRELLLDTNIADISVSHDLNQLIELIGDSNSQLLTNSRNSENQQQEIADACIKLVQRLEIQIRGLNGQYLQVKQREGKFTSEVVRMRQNHAEEVEEVKNELKEERRRREALGNILRATEADKNGLVMRISRMSGSETAALQTKTKEEIIEQLKEMKFRLKDVEAEKSELLSEAAQDKEAELKKYQALYSRVKNIKERTLLGKSAA